jgi:predicted transcriptional regulator
MNDTLIINKNQTILDALIKLSILKDVSRLILFVEDDNKRTIGSLTDGDIRRSLIKSQNINQVVSSICNYNFNYINSGYSFINFKEYRDKNLKILPVLDENKKLVDIILKP